MADDLTEDERRALRGSKFAPLPPPPPSNSLPRLPHPGGPLKTNKAAALAKFLERKLQDPQGIESINPDLLEAAVINAKKTVIASSGTSTSGRKVCHVDSFEDTIKGSEEVEEEEAAEIKKKIKRKKKKAFKDNIHHGGEDTEKKERKKKKKKMKSEHKSAKRKKTKA